VAQETQITSARLAGWVTTREDSVNRWSPVVDLDVRLDPPLDITHNHALTEAKFTNGFHGCAPPPGIPSAFRAANHSILQSLQQGVPGVKAASMG
jgi:hypothetical protein